MQDQDTATRWLDLSGLTLRQREILARLLDGHRVDAIARDLSVSPRTVRNHLSAIFEKLGVASQSELVELLRGHEDGARARDDQSARGLPRDERRAEARWIVGSRRTRRGHSGRLPACFTSRRIRKRTGS